MLPFLNVFGHDVPMYGVMMMARRGEMRMQSVTELFSRLSGVDFMA